MSGSITLMLGGSIDLVLHEPKPPEPGWSCIVITRYRGISVTGRGNMAYQLPSGYCVDVQVSYVDANDNPATIDGEVTWSSSNAAIAEVDADGTDSTHAQISATGDIGNVQISASADADLGSGKRTLVTLMDLTVVAGEAVAGEIAVTGEARPIA